MSIFSFAVEFLSHALSPTEANQCEDEMLRAAEQQHAHDLQQEQMREVDQQIQQGLHEIHQFLNADASQDNLDSP